jgi:hypothetical protein
LQSWWQYVLAFYLACLLTFCAAYLLGFFLAVEVRRYLLASGAGEEKEEEERRRTQRGEVLS